MTLRAALLDATGVYLQIDELASDRDLTPQHLPQITECDLPPGQYRWVVESTAPEGGRFWPIWWLDKVVADAAAARKAEIRKAERERLLALPTAERAAERVRLKALKAQSQAAYDQEMERLNGAKVRSR